MISQPPPPPPPLPPPPPRRKSDVSHSYRKSVRFPDSPRRESATPASNSSAAFMASAAKSTSSPPLSPSTNKQKSVTRPKTSSKAPLASSLAAPTITTTFTTTAASTKQNKPRRKSDAPRSKRFSGSGFSLAASTLFGGNRRHDDDPAREEAIAAALMAHAYHIPGSHNSWMQDLWQHLANNHPVVGICFHHKYHPLKAGIRVATLIGSVLFGLAVTNIIYLAFVFSKADADKEYANYRTNATRTGINEDLDDNLSVVSVTNGNIVLWTLGAFIHAMYDNTVWSLAACTCQKKEENTRQKMRRFKTMGTFMVVLSVVIVTALATLAVAIRAALEVQNNDDGNDGGGTQGAYYANATLGSSNTTKAGILYLKVPVDSFQAYTFIYAYFVELALSYVVYYPLIGTILFSGILTCGRFPVVGGRPYELKLEKEARSQLEDDSFEDLEQPSGSHKHPFKSSAHSSAGTKGLGQISSKQSSLKAANSAKSKKDIASCVSKASTPIIQKGHADGSSNTLAQKGMASEKKTIPVEKKTTKANQAPMIGNSNKVAIEKKKMMPAAHENHKPSKSKHIINHNKTDDTDIETGGPKVKMPPIRDRKQEKRDSNKEEREEGSHPNQAKRAARGSSTKTKNIGSGGDDLPVGLVDFDSNHSSKH